MPFGTGTVVTTLGKGIFAKRVQTTAPAAGAVTPPAAGANPPKNLAMGTGATTATRTAAAGDTSLSQETESRVAGTESIITNTTYQVVGTITATAARAVDEAALFDTSGTTTATSSPAAAATSFTVASGAVFQASGTLYALNRTTPANGAQAITFSANSGNTITCTALTGAITSGDWIVQGNMFASATFPVINLANGDSIQFTWQVTVA